MAAIEYTASCADGNMAISSIFSPVFVYLVANFKSKPQFWCGFAMTDTASDAASVAAPPAPVVVNTLPSLNPPLFFEIVEDQVYRSNKCDASSIPFLATLQLNTVVYLSYDDLSRDLAAFFAEKEINVYRNIAGSVKTRFENEQFIELFDVDLVTLPQQLPSWFTVHQRLMEEERIALTKGEFFPGQSPDKVEEQPKKELSQPEETDETKSGGDLLEGGLTTSDAPTEAAQPEVLAYQKYYFYLQGPLVSPSVKFSEKKSIIGDDDDD
ncbi:hypothetical protein ON010_g4973 [Phytophthora cinnamomi]|nr:hypothetical protein ON010_g4973 [Phytophthora cinnamomi]